MHSVVCLALFVFVVCMCVGEVIVVGINWDIVLFHSFFLFSLLASMLQICYSNVHTCTCMYTFMYLDTSTGHPLAPWLCIGIRIYTHNIILFDYSHYCTLHVICSIVTHMYTTCAYSMWYTVQ